MGSAKDPLPFRRYVNVDGDEAAVRVTAGGVVFYRYDREGPYVAVTFTHADYLASHPLCGHLPDLEDRIRARAKEALAALPNAPSSARLPPAHEARGGPYRSAGPRHQTHVAPPPVARWTPEAISDYLDHARSLDAPDALGHFAVAVAARLYDGLPLLKRVLHTGVDPNGVGEDGEPAIVRAGHVGGLERFEALLAAGADPRKTSERGVSALHTLLSTGPKPDAAAITRRLIEAGLNPDSHSQSRHRPLHYASEFSQIDVARVLLEAGADADAHDQYGSALHMARREDMVALLLEHGAQPHHRDSRGRTALFHQLDPMHPCSAETIERMLRAGSDPDAPDHDGVTPRIRASKIRRVQQREAIERRFPPAVPD